MAEMARSSGLGSRMGYGKARLLLLIGGLAVLLLLTVYLSARQVDEIERYGAALFVPVFVAFVFWNITGGAISGVLAGLAYAALRWKQLDVFGTQDFVELVLARALFYVAFGVVGGWANKQMEGSLNKLELYDQIDDTTGLFNARFFVQDTDLEISRSSRYQTIFSIASVDIPSGPLMQMSKRQRTGMLKDLGRVLKDSVRTVDRAVHASAGTYERMAVVLPETSKEGVRIFTDRLADKLGDYLINKGVPLDKSQIRSSALTFPEDEAAINAMKAEFAAIDKAEHPPEPSE